MQTTIRYAFAANTMGTLPNPAALYPQADITQLTETVNLADLGTRFDIIITLGAYADAVPSPTLLNVALLINENLPPLTNPDLIDIFMRSIDPTQIVQQLDIPEIRLTSPASTQPINLQAELANAGWPDGFELRLAHDSALGHDALQAYFQPFNINLIAVPLSTDFGQTNLTLITWSTMRERNQWATMVNHETYMVDLFGLPISYWAVPELEVTFTPQGWPIASR